jgi:hypothetical protein
MEAPRTTAVDQPSLVDETKSPDPSDPGDLLERLSEVLTDIALAPVGD